jgi:two-component system NtrC family sensor kinase
LLTNGVPMFDEKGNLSGYRGVDKDITERKLAEEAKEKLKSQLLQSEKMSAIGQLAGGIAHELNNPLGIILGYAQTINRSIKHDDSLNHPLKSIEKETLRCKNMVKDLLLFSRTSKTLMEEMDINSMIEQTIPLVESKTKICNVKIESRYSESHLLTMGNMNNLQQVMVNLCNNAIDAMPSGGTIGITTEQIDNFAVIKVVDNGTGITKENVKHIFEPFFTTKDIGKGTGLGLSLCYEIVKKHDGIIEFLTEPGKGTTFIIKLPLKRA